MIENSENNQALFNQTVTTTDTMLFGEEQAEGTETKQLTLNNILKPSNSIMLNSKPVNEYTQIQDALTAIDNTGQWTILPDKYPLRVSREGAKKEVSVWVNIGYYGELQGKKTKINEYDKAVLNAICSIYQAGNIMFKLSDIYREMTQKNGGQSEKALQKIKESMYKMSATRIGINVQQELKEHLIEDDGEKIVDGTIDGACLSFKMLDGISETGRNVTAIALTEEPVLYTYSKLKGHILSFPVQMMELPDKMRAEDDVLIIRDYLIKQINQMSMGERNNFNISYESILEKIGKNPKELDRRIKGKITEKIQKLLDDYKDRGFIRGYKQQIKNKNQITGFTIDPLPKDNWEALKDSLRKK